MLQFAGYKMVFRMSVFIVLLFNSACGAGVATTPTVEKINISTQIPPTSTATFTSIPSNTATFTLTPSNTTTPTATFTITPTPTATYTPTSTFTLTPTRIPDLLGNISPEFSANDFSLASGQFQFQLTEMLGLKTINNGEYKPAEGNQYFVLRGYLYNYAEHDQNFSELDFQADFNEIRDVSPNTDLMYALQQTQYPAAGYPSRNFFRSPNFTVLANRAVEIILVYEAPIATDYLKLYFNPNGVQPRSSIGILLFAQADTNRFLLLKESIDGDTQFTIAFADGVTGGILEELIDRQLEIVDNCFNDEVRKKSITYEQSEKFEIKLINHTNLSLGLPPYFYGFTLTGLLNLAINQQHEKINTTELTISQTEELTAGARKRTAWEFQAYKVSLSGTIIVTFGTQTFEVPYTITDRLRVEVVSKPADPCPDFTATP